MTETLAQEPDLFAQPTYLPRVTRRDGRAIEEALAGPTLFNKGVSFAGAVIEATYAVVLRTTGVCVFPSLLGDAKRIALQPGQLD